SVALDTGVVEADVVRRPPSAERLACRASTTRRQPLVPGEGDLRPWPPAGSETSVNLLSCPEVTAVRSEDKNARQVQQAFADGATLAELEQHIAYLRSRGAPDDAHPRVGVNDDYEITVMICV